MLERSGSPPLAGLIGAGLFYAIFLYRIRKARTRFTYMFFAVKRLLESF
jgi:hypothetical protein